MPKQKTMKSIKNNLPIICMLLIAISAIQSCSKSCPECQCTRQCLHFNKDSIIICSWNYPSVRAYYNASDSLSRLYNPPDTAIFIGNPYQGTDCNRAGDKEIINLQNAGYICICAD
jgi:hypothetical protein